MSLKKNFELMAQYNQWMNGNIYQLSSSLSGVELAQERGCYFGSILATLNHLLVGDTFWFKRFARHPAGFKSLNYVSALPMPASLDAVDYTEFSDLKQARVLMDAAIIDFTVEATEADYEVVLTYQNSRGQSFSKHFSYLVHHIFNHQTHHRGQVTTMLSQSGLDIGMTDMLALIPEQ